jgi:GNAT superfamily N-acetyltransferase
MKYDDFSIDPIAHADRAVFEIWHDRFVNEYNRSKQARVGRQLCVGTPQAHWDVSFEYEVGPRWIKYKNRNIGYVAPQSVAMGSSAETARQVKMISDVYVDPKFRGRGILAAVLLTMREQGMAPILIDEKKLRDNIGYYIRLGFKFIRHWADQDLLIVSPDDQGNPEWWSRLYPEELEHQAQSEMA